MKRVFALLLAAILIPALFSSCQLREIVPTGETATEETEKTKVTVETNAPNPTPAIGVWKPQLRDIPNEELYSVLNQLSGDQSFRFDLLPSDFDLRDSLSGMFGSITIELKEDTTFVITLDLETLGTDYCRYWTSIFDAMFTTGIDTFCAAFRFDDESTAQFKRKFTRSGLDWYAFYHLMIRPTLIADIRSSAQEIDKLLSTLGLDATKYERNGNILSKTDRWRASANGIYITIEDDTAFYGNVTLQEDEDTILLNAGSFYPLYKAIQLKREK